MTRVLDWSYYDVESKWMSLLWNCLGVSRMDIDYNLMHFKVNCMCQADVGLSAKIEGTWECCAFVELQVISFVVCVVKELIKKNLFWEDYWQHSRE